MMSYSLTWVRPCPGRNCPSSLRLSKRLLGMVEARMRSIDPDMTSFSDELKSTHLFPCGSADDSCPCMLGIIRL